MHTNQPLIADIKPHLEDFTTQVSALTRIVNELKQIIIGRPDIDKQIPISTSIPFILDYKERKYVFVYSGVGLTLQVADFGNVTVNANTWVMLPFEQSSRVLALGQPSQINILVRLTDNPLSFFVNSAIVGIATVNANLNAGTNSIGTVGLNTGTNTVGNIGELGLPVGASQINAVGTATAGTATATLTGVAAKFTYLTGWMITIIDTATAGSAEGSLSGINGGPLTYEIDALGVASGYSTYQEQFTTPLQSTAVNTNIVFTLPTLGAGTGKVSIVLHGYLL